MRLCFVDNHNFQILSFILQINNSYQIEALKLICSIFQMFARQCDKCLLPMMIDIWFCLEITTIAKIILITMALRLACSNYFHFFFFCFFQKKTQQNGKQWVNEWKKNKMSAPIKNHFKILIAHVFRLSSVFAIAIFFVYIYFFRKKKANDKWGCFVQFFPFWFFLSLSLSLCPCLFLYCPNQCKQTISPFDIFL